MALIRWQPFHEVDSLQRDMNRLFDRFITNNNEENITSAFQYLLTKEYILVPVLLTIGTQ
jgi:HSP20 family protein